MLRGYPKIFRMFFVVIEFKYNKSGRRKSVINRFPSSVVLFDESGGVL